MTTPTTALIRPASLADADAIATIYNHYVASTVVTFEEEPVSSGDMANRIEELLAQGLPWLVVAHPEHGVLGYAYASKWKGRCAYRFSVESTVYLAPGVQRQGLGSLLYTALFEQLRARELHAVMAGIALPNDASVALHEKFGLRQVAHFREVGFKFERWLDTGYWQVLL